MTDGFTCAMLWSKNLATGRVGAAACRVVDMFGCGLPVLSAAYSCISELVEPGKTGLLFTDPQELAEQLLQLFEGFPAQISADLQNMRSHVQARRKSPNASWSQAWEQTVMPLFVSNQ